MKMNQKKIKNISCVSKSKLTRTRCKNQRHGKTLMNDLDLLQIACQQSHRNLAQYFVDELVESLAHRKNDENDDEIYHWSCRT